MTPLKFVWLLACSTGWAWIGYDIAQALWPSDWFLAVSGVGACAYVILSIWEPLHE